MVGLGVNIVLVGVRVLFFEAKFEVLRFLVFVVLLFDSDEIVRRRLDAEEFRLVFVASEF